MYRQNLPSILTTLTFLALTALLATATMSPVPAQAQDSPASINATATTPTKEPSPGDLVQVDWFQEMIQGGMTMVALGLLSVGLAVIVVERLFMLRENRYVPRGLVTTICGHIQRGNWDAVRSACKGSPSLFSHAVMHITQHLGTDRETLMAGAGDIAARELTESEQRLGSLGLIAGLAPLLGLLGTMIGMIESFKLVEVFGDEGGASMLAGSISKALITTAAGLIIAMPALLAHYAFKRKTQRIAREVEQALERVSNAILQTQLRHAAEAQQTAETAPAEH